MSDLTRALGIPIATVERHLEAALGFGNMYSRRSTSEEGTGISLFLAASSYRAAGAHALLLMAADEARVHFQRAADLFVRARSPYGAFLANLGLEPATLPEDMPSGPEAVFALWGTRALAEGYFIEQRGDLALELTAFRSKRVGVLGLEVGLLMDLRGAALNWLQRGSMESVMRPLNVVVAYYAEAVNRARANRYHWERLRMTFHPLEPDILGILVGLDRVLASADASLSEVLPNLPQREDVVEVLQLSLKQFHAWGHE